MKTPLEIVNDVKAQDMDTESRAFGLLSWENFQGLTRVQCELIRIQPILGDKDALGVLSSGVMELGILLDRSDRENGVLSHSQHYILRTLHARLDQVLLQNDPDIKPASEDVEVITKHPVGALEGV